MTDPNDDQFEAEAAAAAESPETPAVEEAPVAPATDEPAPQEDSATESPSTLAPVEDGNDSDEDDEEKEDGDELAHGKMGLIAHLEELRHRLKRALYGLVFGMAITLCFARSIIQFLKKGYMDAAQAAGMKNVDLQTLHLTDGMIVWMKVGLIGGAVLASPWISYQLWQFVASGLYKKEKRIVTRTVPFSALLFSGGACFFLFVVSPTLFGAMLWFSKWLGVEVNQVLSNYLKFVTTMMLVFGLSFQMPLVIAILGKVGLINTKWINNYRRHMIVGIMIFSAFTTSQSPIDTVMLAVPLWMLFELGALFVWRETKKRAAQALLDGDTDDDDDDWDDGDDSLFAVREDDDDDSAADQAPEDTDPDYNEDSYDGGEYDEWGYYIDEDEKFGKWGKGDAHIKHEVSQKGVFGAKASPADEWLSLRSNLKDSAEELAPDTAETPSTSEEKTPDPVDETPEPPSEE